MSALRGNKPLHYLFLIPIINLAYATLSFSPVILAQEQPVSAQQVMSAQTDSRPETTVSLQGLLNEAERNNPQVRAARQSWESAKQVPPQVSALPDPQAVVQEFTVGSPRPFAGYTNSNFAYIGLGVSQDLPYPGKLKLKGEIAKRDAGVAQQEYEAVRRSVLAGVKTAYFQLVYLSKTLGILQSDGQLLGQVEKAADARYRSGMGNQQDILQAQLEQTKLLRTITMQHLEAAKAQAQLKQLLNRSQSSPDIEPAEISETPLSQTFEELLAAAQKQNPEISGDQEIVQREKLQVDLAHKDFRPDFSLQYMWQRTDPEQYRAYYMLTFGVSLPIHRAKLHAELAQTEIDLDRSRSDLEAQSQQVASELRVDYDTAQKTADLLKIYREGLIPQARAEFQAGIVAYQNNRSDFQTLLNSFMDVLNLDEQYWQSFADRESALARIGELTGIHLQDEGAQK
ncbi:MAG TPA: TolC family protein [Candidatus Acidoferrales bacterium]|nr:TolC family protein [Candidatus Acidoferrales bacterium]